MKRLIWLVIILALAPVSLHAQSNKPNYVSLPGPGNVQHLAYALAKEPGAKV
jgi:hypothetical protein